MCKRQGASEILVQQIGNCWKGVVNFFQQDKRTIAAKVGGCALSALEFSAAIAFAFGRPNCFMAGVIIGFTYKDDLERFGADTKRIWEIANVRFGWKTKYALPLGAGALVGYRISLYSPYIAISYGAWIGKKWANLADTLKPAIPVWHPAKTWIRDIAGDGALYLLFPHALAVGPVLGVMFRKRMQKATERISNLWHSKFELAKTYPLSTLAFTFQALLPNLNLTFLISSLAFTASQASRAATHALNKLTALDAAYRTAPATDS